MTDLINLNDQQKEADVINGRIIASAVLVMVLSLALVIRLYALQVTQHEYQVSVAEKNRVHLRPIVPARGVIYDRNKAVLAKNT
ncbi:penicillin-binding protein 2, partial [Klebsiella pneumoniae]|nr:penicillin-binding protein 2 [Klebsiella pneumoniae]